MLNFLRRRWFMVAILSLIPFGMWLGMRAKPETVSTFPKWIVQLASGLITAVILFLMSVTLENRRMLQSFRSPGPVLWGTFVGYVLMPLMATCLLPFQRLEDFTVGLMVAASVPSTLAAASVWTRKAGGNDAISMLVTILTNGFCFIITPLWLQYGLGNSIELDSRAMTLQLFLTALLPILLGQTFRLWGTFRKFADRAKAGFSAVAQICILLIVFWASVQSGVKVNAGQSGSNSLQGIPALIVWGSCIALHLTCLVVAMLGGRIFRFSRADIIGTAFSGSQKTLPIGLFVAVSLAGDTPFALLPVLMFHASQLILDTLFIDRMQLWVNSDPLSASSPLAHETST